MKHSILISMAAILVFTTITSCKKDDNKSPKTLYGTAVALGGDSIRSFVTLDENGQAQSVGLQFGENALNDLPTDTMPGMPNYMYQLSMPQYANAAGIDHIEADWNPFGHEPHAVYGVPHFDFHFYYVTAAEQASVVPGPDAVPVPPQFIPKDYFVPVPIAVPYMGVHWFDSTVVEFHGAAFTSTFIYGFYHGNMTFLEPMITKAFLQTHPDFSAAIKQPQSFQKSNYYPTTYQVKYDATKHVYLITLLDLVKH
jgi:Domain of unknown function (DUF5602)